MVILALTALVWGAVAMSEVREFPLKVRVVMTGFDRSRYAVLQADSSVTVQVKSSGFKALLYSLKGESLELKLDINGEVMRHYSRQGERGKQLWHSVAMEDLSDRLDNDLSGKGMKMAGSAKDSLRLVLAERKSKVFRVDISSVKITFAEGYGLYGEPTVIPSEVTLYGDEESLSKIERLNVVPLEIKDLKKSDAFTLTLDTAWQSNDVYASAAKVTLNVPVEQYVEREFELPITVEGLDNAVRINLYPDKVTLRAWVSRRDIASVTAERFVVAVDYQEATARTSTLRARLTRFPQKVRVHSLTPEEVKYVVIK